MMTEARPEQESFQSLLWSLYGQIAENDPLQKLRARAWDHFLELGLPTIKDDVYRYMRLRHFFSRPFVLSTDSNVRPEQIEPYILPECQQSVIVLVNGRYSAQLSRTESLPKRIVVSDLIEASQSFGAFLNNQWTKSVKEEIDPFAAANSALHSDGVFVYIPPKTVLETPIQLLTIVDAQNASMLIMPRIHLFCGAHSQISLAATQGVLSGQEFCVNQVTDLNVEENAHLQYTQTICGLPENAWHFDAFRASLKKNSTLKTVGVTDGSVSVRNDYKVMLVGENAEATLNGVCMLNGKHEVHTHVLIDHQAPSCRSMQLFKGVLNDASKSSFEGKILVRQAAQKTNAFQLNNNLLLSNEATANSKPNLEIFADDVKASHGATVGQLDEEQIFYMKTRGHSAKEAQNILVYGFCQEILNMLTIPSLFEKMKENVQKYLFPG